jgi:hypothetical protein
VRTPSRLASLGTSLSSKSPRFDTAPAARAKKSRPPSRKHTHTHTLRSLVLCIIVPTGANNDNNDNNNFKIGFQLIQKVTSTLPL